ncbi:GGDEF domain-containing protein [Pseudomonas sp. DP-17]|uniref:GGDEF domain-containing protein n=1 Tax=Pseudomonas sp. DP-17 TaxID=1580486 RepID=UPI001EFAB6E2|nr:GGDEF domain-containing protein [Pseudomonas sp. DP-17]MCG8911452.1 GGDEF domain-containing protein [Pseudomonas sp. DP-17]
MNKSILANIEKDIRELPEIMGCRVETNRTPNSSEFSHILKQLDFLEKGAGRFSTKFIFIDEDEISVTAELKKSTYSPGFSKLKSTIERIISQHINAYNATRDKLTEIYNRHGFEKEIRKYQNYPFITFCIADIDNFKQINDSFSHEHGDLVLKAFSKSVAKVCSRKISETQKIVYSRYGGEEFVFAIFSQSPDIALPEEIRSSISGRTERTEYHCSLGFSVHSIDYQLNKAQLSTLYKEADAALYKSKKEGKDRSTLFSEIKKSLGKVIETDAEHNICAIDIGKNTGVTIDDRFKVLPQKYSGREPFIVDDGRSKKPIGTYPKLEIGILTPFDIQDEITFCKIELKSKIEVKQGDRLELLTPEENFIHGFNQATEEQETTE